MSISPTRLVVDVTCATGDLAPSLHALLLETLEGRLELICALETFRFFDHYGDRHEWTETEARAWMINGEALVQLVAEDEWHLRTREGQWAPVPSGGLKEKVQYVPLACAPVSIGQAQLTAFREVACSLGVHEGVLHGRTPSGTQVQVAPVVQLPPGPLTLFVMSDGAVLQFGDLDPVLFLQRLGSTRFEQLAPAQVAARLPLLAGRSQAWRGGLPRG